MPPENRRRRATSVGPDTSRWTPADREKHLLELRMGTPVAEMKLSVRVINTLEEYSVIMARDLIAQTYETLMGMKNFGDKTLREVRAAVKALGLPVPVQWKKPTKRPVVKPRSNSAGGIIDFW